MKSRMRERGEELSLVGGDVYFGSVPRAPPSFLHLDLVLASQLTPKFPPFHQFDKTRQ